MTVIVDGSAAPGGGGLSVSRVSWNWGDGSLEDHPFPNTHTYTQPGSYVITVTAFQSDGQLAQQFPIVTVSMPTTVRTKEPTPEPTTPATTTAATTAAPTPTGTATPVPTATAGPPVFALSPPRIENETVVIEGTIGPGGPGAVVDLVIWDWGDGVRDTQNTLPVRHVYRAAGDYTISVEAIQSEVDDPEARLTSTTTFPVSITHVPETYPTGTATPDGNGFHWPAVRLFGINIFPLLLILAVGLLIGGLLYARSREATAPGIPTTDAIERAAASYQEARERGDLEAAKGHALDAARLLVIQAEAVPRYGDAYLEKAEIWKEYARTIEDQAVPEEAPTPPEVVLPPPVPVSELIGDGSDGNDGEGDARGELLAGTDIEPAVFDAVLRTALEIAREGREGKPVGTAFLLGDVDGVLAYSTQFILNPFKGHTAEERLITDGELAENIKEFALLDGAFVISGDGVVEAAGRYITVDTSAVQIPAGLGSRHASVAGITLVTGTIGIVVSQSGGLIKIFKNGRIVRTVSPW
ncbi:MAG: PKD domain-containing protein [Methanospirillum sp.]|nr:PKD domain-containing protein [Methanospirillum sp.]